VAFLPLLKERASFDLLVYTDKEVLVPSTWEDSDPRYIQNAEEVKLRSLSTKVHKINTSVAYKMAAEDEA
jgi:mitotic spindle assembly checkpoint protein MAD2